MNKYLAILCIVFNFSSLSAKCSEVAPNIKNEYASNMHYAFVLLSMGKSTLAHFQFQSAYEQAKKAGEVLQD